MQVFLQSVIQLVVSQPGAEPQLNMLLEGPWYLDDGSMAYLSHINKPPIC